jgi:hypothetical protein
VCVCVCVWVCGREGTDEDKGCNKTKQTQPVLLLPLAQRSTARPHCGARSQTSAFTEKAKKVWPVSFAVAVPAATEGTYRTHSPYKRVRAAITFPRRIQHTHLSGMRSESRHFAIRHAGTRIGKKTSRTRSHKRKKSHTRSKSKLANWQMFLTMAGGAPKTVSSESPLKP